MIECKSSIGNPQSDVLRPLVDQIAAVEQHKKDLEEEVGGEIINIEYVICSIPQDIEEVGKVLVDEPVCLWSADLFNFKLKLYNPSVSMDGKETGKLIIKKQLHAGEE